MNHTQILKRSWNILWSYKMLWVFGFLLALTSASGGGGNNFRYNMSRRDFSQRQFDLPPEMRELARGLERFFSNEMVGAWVGVVIALVCVALLVAVIFTIVKYVSKTALMRMVDDHETTSEKAGWRQGFRLGWSRSAWRLFLIDVVIGVPLAVIVIGLVGCALLPVIIGGMAGRGEPAFAWVLTTLGLIFVLIFVFFVVSLAVGLVINLIHRTCVLGGSGVIDSIRQGLKLVGGNFKDVFVMWLILVGVRIAYAIVIIPVALLLIGIGLVVGGPVGLAVYFGLRAIASQTVAIVTAAFLGLGLFFTIISLPLTFLEGLRQTYFSTTWTLTYRELTAFKPVEPVDDGEALPPPAGVPA